MKYKKIMENIELNDAMKEDILTQIQKPKPHFWKKRWVQVSVLGVCALLAMTMALPLLQQAISFTGFKNAASSSTAYVSDSDGAKYESYEVEGPYSGSSADLDGGTSLPLEMSSAKLVYRSWISMETRDFDQTMSQVQDLVQTSGGFMASESYDKLSNDMQYANLECRIPTEKLNTFLEELQQAGTITSSSKSAENITKNYYQTTGQIASLEKERERLNELMDRAESVADLIAIESQLSSVEEQLQWAQNDLAGMDLDLEYSTVSLNIREVQVYTSSSSSSWNNLASAFSDTWYYFFDGLGSAAVFLVYLLPWILLAAAAILVWRWYARRKQKKHNALFADENAKDLK